MGKIQFIKNTSIIVVVSGVAYIGFEFLNKSLKTESKNLTLIEQNHTKLNAEEALSFSNHRTLEENQTLEKKYQSVASQIEAFMKRQKLKAHTTTEQNEITMTQVENNFTTDINLTEVNKIVVKKTHIKALKSVKKRVDKKSQNLPKLAIIMDDVGFYEDVHRIKKIPFAITPAIFPPNEHYPETTKIAKKFKHHMVHFPMEAYKYKNIKEEALKVSDKIEVIEKKVQKMQKNFPNAIAINNHTGSKYTCDFDAMEQFFSVLNKYNINFIDSRTSSATQCQEVGKLLNKKVLQRDIFLDNRADVIYIKNQLKEAVNLAKKNGTAIAICHPRDMTFKALMSCEGILEGVELVYINELL